MENRRFLAIDTSDHVCSVAISLEDKILVEKSIGNKLNHSQTLMPLIESAFNEVDFNVSEIDKIFVTEGPGSFTGIRIGVSTAKALAHFKSIPIVGVKTLVNIASLVDFEDENCIIVPLIDARRSTFYTAFFEKTFQNQIGEILHEEIDVILELLSKYNEKIYLVGDKLNSLLYDKELKENIEIVDTTENIHRASNMLKNSIELLNNDVNIKTYKTIEPFYLKKSQAEREYDEKQGVK